MTVVADEVGRHDTLGGACSKESNTLRYGHHTWAQHACVENFLAEGGRYGLGKRDLVSNINWYMNVPVDPDGALGIVDGISAPGLSVSPARRARRAGPGQQLPADQQPVQRLRPDAGADGRSRGVTLRHAARRQPRRDRRPDPAHRAQELGLRTVAVYSDADAGAAARAPGRHRGAPRPGARGAVVPARGAASSTRPSRTAPARSTPGTGSSARTPAFARAVEAAGIAFVGPTPEQLELFGSKHTARDAARAVGVPMLAGTGLLGALDEAIAAADAIGYPVMLKATAGGGGIGMRACRSPDQLVAAWEAVRRTAGAAFGSAGVFLERLVTAARHVEVQVFGDGLGRVVTLGDRDCSLQRRHQKVVEEAPAPGSPTHVRRRIDDVRPHARRVGELPVGRHGRVRLRRRAARGGVPRGEHPPAGRAPGHRGGVRRRPGRVDDPAGPGRHVRRRHPARTRAAPRSRPASTPRTPTATTCPSAGHGHRVRGPRRRPRRHLDRARHRGLHPLRPAAGQGHHGRRRPRERLARPGRRARPTPA